MGMIEELYFCAHISKMYNLHLKRKPETYVADKKQKTGKYNLYPK